MSACNCCEAPPCLEPQIWWESISTNAQKCGHSQFSGPARRFRVSTELVAENRVSEFNHGGGWVETLTKSISTSRVATKTLTNGSCSAPAYLCSGTFSAALTTAGLPEGGTDNSYSCSATLLPGCPSFLVWTTGCDGHAYTEPGFPGLPAVVSPTLKFDDWDFSSNPDEVTWVGSRSITLTDEFTTDDLLVDALLRLPPTVPFSGILAPIGALNPEGTTKTLSLDETVLHARKAQFRVAHFPSATCYLKVWFQEHFVDAYPPYALVVSDSAIPPYEWIGTGSPCGFNDPTLSAHDSFNRILGPITVLDLPALHGPDGHRRIYVKKWSCVPGYEPDGTEAAPNGFPAIIGCKNASALNYNPLATYQPTPSPCTYE